MNTVRVMYIYWKPGGFPSTEPKATIFCTHRYHLRNLRAFNTLIKTYWVRKKARPFYKAPGLLLVLRWGLLSSLSEEVFLSCIGTNTGGFLGKKEILRKKIKRCTTFPPTLYTMMNLYQIPLILYTILSLYQNPFFVSGYGFRCKLI